MKIESKSETEYRKLKASELFAGDLYATPGEDYYVVGYTSAGKHFVNLETGFIVSLDAELNVRRVKGIVSFRNT